WLDTIYIAVILLQGTYTPLVYAHDGRTQKKAVNETVSTGTADAVTPKKTIARATYKDTS
ncbi:MAG: hypothetical protein KZQ70_10720, partial [gamma proteobacterium symbiont of Lucinoma myriamae]|nr:hypothetical protein [gamma proteobacterium symbiont of Lucinoma myriamae]MCU7818981.1 hypothetical protein [gamma proteobacterium symbiont of Lucinoma myriamae]MCU7832937.1 hypothetical protein [gamma proteobacterium symbiont of Lucinoma myriamae]